MKPFFWTPLSLSLFALTASAQAPQNVPATPTSQTPTPATALSPADQNALDAARSLARTASLWNHRFDWKEVGSSTADIVAHIKAALGDKAPLIEVRGKDTNRVTFVLKAAPLGPTLSSLGELGNLKVWVFPNRLVLAPESLLSADERSAIERRAGGEWKQSSNAGVMSMSPWGAGWNAREEVNRVAFSIIGTDLKDQLAAKGQPIPATQPVPAPQPQTTVARQATVTQTISQTPAPFELPYNELSPASQQVLQNLLDSRYEGFTPQSGASIVLDASIIVCLEESNSSTRLFLRKADVPIDPKVPRLAEWRIMSASSPFSRRPTPFPVAPTANQRPEGAARF